MTARASNNIPTSLRELWEYQDTYGRAAVPPSFRDDNMSSGRAIVCHDTHANGGWKMEDVGVRKPGEGELLVEMVASGVCHTDVLIGDIPGGGKSQLLDIHSVRS